MDAPDAPGQAINVATGQRIRIADLARQLAHALGSALQPELTGESRAGDIRHCFADTARARDLLGFNARRSLTDGLPELADWVSRQQIDERGDNALRQLRKRGLVG